MADRPGSYVVEAGEHKPNLDDGAMAGRSKAEKELDSRLSGNDEKKKARKGKEVGDAER